MHTSSSHSSTDEEGEYYHDERRIVEQEDPSSPRDYDAMENMIRIMGQVVAQTPDEKNLCQLLLANHHHATREDPSLRFVTPPTTRPTTTVQQQQVPSSRSFDVPSPLSNRDGFSNRSIVDYQYQVLDPVSAKSSSIETEPRTQESAETRKYPRTYQASRHHQQQQYPDFNKKTTALTAGLATSFVLTILLGIPAGLMGGLFAAYAHDKEGIVGDCSRALGEVALITREKAMDINVRYKLVRRVRFALMIAWECATTIDRKNNAFKNMIVYHHVVLTNLVDAFHYETTRFHSHSFWREDNLLDHHHNDASIATRAAGGMEPINLLRRARY